MKVLFVYPDLLDFLPDYPGHYYEGIGSLSAFLKADGHETGLIHVIRTPGSREAFTRTVFEHQPDLVAFSATTLQFGLVKEWATWLKGKAPVPLICGGVHTSLMPEQSLRETELDMVCVGEGEKALGELCRRMEAGEAFQDIPGIWVKDGKDIRRNPAPPPEGDLDHLPFPDRTIFDFPSLWWERRGTATLMASRGCPFGCAYCCNKALRKIYTRTPPACRRRSVEGVIGEIQQIRRDYPFVTSVNFDDDILFMEKKWSRPFAERYREEVALPFYCNIRPNVVDDEMVELLRVAGCQEIRVGLESGNEEIRNDVLKRNISREQILNACRSFQKAGIPVRTFNIIGIPEETPGRILETIQLNAELGIEDPQYTIFYPFPGTELHERYGHQGLILSKTMTDYYVESTLELPNLSTDHLQMFRVYFHKILKVYQLLFRVPARMRRPLLAGVDALFASRAAPPLLKAVHGLRRALRRG